MTSVAYRANFPKIERSVGEECYFNGCAKRRKADMDALFVQIRNEHPEWSRTRADMRAKVEYMKGRRP